MKIYISGKVSGLTETEYKSRFKIAAEALTQSGWDHVVNPCEIEHCEGATWEKYMLKDIEELFKCNAIYMLNNWRESKGARIEHSVAVETGKKIFYQP